MAALFDDMADALRLLFVLALAGVAVGFTAAIAASALLGVLEHAMRSI